MGVKQSTLRVNQDVNALEGSTDLAIHQLPDSLIRELACDWLTLGEVRCAEKEIQKHQHVVQHQKGNAPCRLFSSLLKETEACYAVLGGQPEKLLRLLRDDPLLFFKPCSKVTDPAGQMFYHVSPADLVYFLGDKDMLRQVFKLVHYHDWALREVFFKKWQALHRPGGADLVMFKGTEPPRFDEVSTMEHVFNVEHDALHVMVSLLKNPDGLVCWESPDGQLSWYYACSNTKTLALLELPELLSEQYQSSYDTFCSRMKAMEDRTARRSSDDEYRLIISIMKHAQTKKALTIVRKGIRYQQDGIHYTDTHYDMHRFINVYLKSFYLYESDITREEFKAAYAELEALRHASETAGEVVRARRISQKDVHSKVGDNRNQIWLAGVGHVQREVMWLLQRYCESVYRLGQLNPELALSWGKRDSYNHAPFKRSFNTYVQSVGCPEIIFNPESWLLSPGLGCTASPYGFALNKSYHGEVMQSKDSECHYIGHDLDSVNYLFSKGYLYVNKPVSPMALADEPEEVVLKSLGMPF